MSRPLTTVLALVGATAAISTGVSLDRVILPKFDKTASSGSSTVIARQTPAPDPESKANGTAPDAPGGPAGAQTPTGPAPALKPLRGQRPRPGSTNSPTPGGSGGGGGSQNPPGASGPEGSVAELTNKERAKVGCGPLRVDQRLVTAARRHSADMAANHYFSHTSKNGDSFADRIQKAGYPSPGAENIAMGYGTPAAVMTGWMNSSGHRANILNCKLKAIGVGVQTGSGGPWWTQDFGWS